MPHDGGADPAAQPAFDPESYASWFETDLGRLVWRDERAALLPLLGPVQGCAALDAGVGEARLRSSWPSGSSVRGRRELPLESQVV